MGAPFAGDLDDCASHLRGSHTKVRLVCILRLRLRSLFLRSKVDAELEEELQYHLDRQIELEIAAGSTPEEARYAALRSITDIQQRKEECRDAREFRWF